MPSGADFRVSALNSSSIILLSPRRGLAIVLRYRADTAHDTIATISALTRPAPDATIEEFSQQSPGPRLQSSRPSEAFPGMVPAVARD